MCTYCAVTICITNSCNLLVIMIIEDSFLSASAYLTLYKNSINETKSTKPKSMLRSFLSLNKNQHFFSDSLCQNQALHKFMMKYVSMLTLFAYVCLVKQRRLSWKINNKYWRHIAISDGGHGDHGPPEPIRNGLEVWACRPSFSKIYGTREQNDT